VTLQDLQPRVIQENTMITLKIVSYTTLTSGVKMFAEDKNKELIALKLYNQVPLENTFAEVQQVFEVGSTIVIK
jgi:hypothetical protein